jgi:hypothetical protein
MPKEALTEEHDFVETLMDCVEDPPSCRCLIVELEEDPRARTTRKRESRSFKQGMDPIHWFDREPGETGAELCAARGSESF